VIQLNQALLHTTEMPAGAREKMLFAALRLFTTKGYRETSILEVVEAARVSKTTFYNNFTGKEDLLVRLFEQLTEEILGEVGQAVQEEKRVTYKAYAGIRRYIDLCIRRESVAQLLLIASVGISKEVEAVRREAHERFSRLISDTVKEWLPENVPDGEIRTVARAMVGAINEVVIQRVMDGSGFSDIDQLARLLNRIVVGSFSNLVAGCRISD
jgi:AcrR family transcriptional regulator